MSSSPPRIEDLTAPPIVGEVYLVPCLHRQGEWIATQGPVHADPELGVPQRHLHYDVRFVSDEMVRRIGLRHARRSSALEEILAHVLPAQTLVKVLFTAVMIIQPDEAPEHRPMRCVREMPTYELIYTNTWLERLERTYAGAHVTDGRCPHRGLPLLSLPQQDGKVVCPGHGLCWQLKDGCLAPHPPEVHATIRRLGALVEKLR